jgi:hypothetical protein
VLAHPEHPGVVRRWIRELAGDDVTVLYLGGLPPALPDAGEHAPKRLRVDDLVQLRDRLARLGPLDVIVVTPPPGKLAPLAEDHYALLPHVYFHLSADGVLAVDRSLERGKRSPLAPARWHRLLGASGSDAPAVPLTKTEVALSEAIRALLVSRRHVIAGKRDRHLYKLREDQVHSLLADREPGLHVETLTTLPPGTLETAGAEHMYGHTDIEPLPQRLDHPQLELRHYRGDLVSRGGTLLYSQSAVLPETYRWPWADELGHPNQPAVSDSFVAAGPRPRRALEGDFYFLDCLFSGHFGHLMTEVVSRLWGWEHAKEQVPGLKGFFHEGVGPIKNSDLERRLFTAYGIAESDLVSSRRPVRLSSVVGASPMWHNRAPFWAHPSVQDTWSRLTSGLLAGREPGRQPRIFVSRGRDLQHRRGCHNQDDVERFFADRGFLVLYPEEHALEEQAAIFAGARVVAGFAGSAMFNLMHSQHLEAVIVLSSSAYVHRNEQLFARIRGAQLHHFWSPHDEVSPSAGPRAYARAPWAFDFGGLGHDLDRVLAQL